MLFLRKPIKDLVFNSLKIKKGLPLLPCYFREFIDFTPSNNAIKKIYHLKAIAIQTPAYHIVLGYHNLSF